MKKCCLIDVLLILILLVNVSCVFEHDNVEDPYSENFKYTPEIKVSKNNLSKITILWDKIPYASKYHLYRSDSQTGEFQNIAIISDTKYYDTNIKAGKKYYYKLMAELSTNRNTEFSKTKYGFCIVENPKDFTASDGDDPEKIILNWLSINNIDNYHIYRSIDDNNNFVKIAVTYKNSYEDTDVETGVLYRYRLRGASESSCVVNNFSEDTGYVKTQMPQIVTVSQGIYTDKIIIKFDPVKNADGYNIYRKLLPEEDHPYDLIGTITNTYYEDKSAQAGMVYIYRVSAFTNKTCESDLNNPYNHCTGCYFKEYYEKAEVWGEQGSNPGEFDKPIGIACDNDNNVYVADSVNLRIQKFNEYGTVIDTWDGFDGLVPRFQYPRQIYIFDERLYVSDATNRLQKYTLDGTLKRFYGYDLKFLTWGFCVTNDEDKKYYTANTVENYIATGNFDGMVYVPYGKIGKSGSGNGEFTAPHDVDYDSRGNIYVTDSENHRLQKFTPDGKFITMVGSQGHEPGFFGYPEGIFIDRCDDMIYVADSNNHRVQKFNTDLNLITIIGSDSEGNGKLEKPLDVTVDTNGNVYVTEENYHRVIKYVKNTN